jgi:3-hydroxybutyryl-CoA dehydratase
MLDHQLQRGHKDSIKKIFLEEDLKLFSELTFDRNPLHLDDDFEEETSFGRRIAHGMHVSALISAVVGTKLPGPGTIFLRQTLSYPHPVYIGDEITAEVEVVSLTRKGLVNLNFSCRNQDGVLVVEGSADVKVPRRWTQQYYQ